MCGDAIFAEGLEGADFTEVRVEPVGSGDVATGNPEK